MVDETPPQLPPTFVGLLKTVANRESIDPELGRRLEDVLDYLEQPPAEGPFLTILLRTQGKRIEPLKDALLCISAQTETDFEVIVLEHDATPEASADVARVLSRLAPDFAEKVRLIEVEGGTRAKPLNVGVLASRGRYIAVYDDDDLVFANWVEAFLEGTHGQNGRLVRSVVANQKVTPEVWPGGQLGFRTGSWPAAEYPKQFDLLQHMLVNYSPFMSWAFPSSLFSHYGMRFDEELTVCEDWDVILRGSLLCGVNDTPYMTAIYRRWQGGESSYTTHSMESWKRSEQRVIDRINDQVIMMPPGTMDSTRRMVVFNTAMDNYKFMFHGTSLRRPFNYFWDVTRPFFKLAVRARNRIRRMRAK